MNRIRTAGWTRRTQRTLLIGLVALLGAGVAVTVLGQQGADDGPTQVDALISALRADLAVATDPADRANIEGKLAELEADRESELTGRQAALEPSFERDASEKRQQVIDDGVANDSGALRHAEWIPAGAGFIVEDATPFEHPREFVAENDWFVELDDGGILVVWAGRDGEDRQQGVLRVWSESKEDHGLKAVIPIPGRHGPARVASADEWILEVVSEDGTVHHFDAKAWTLD